MERQVVVFELDNESYAVEIGGVKEIVRLPEITKVPHAPDYVDGVIDLRGQVTAVINLRSRFGLPVQETTKDTRVIVLTMGDAQVGVVVDGVSETLSIPEESIDAIANMALEIDAEYITGVARLENRLVILLDYKKVLSASENEALAELVTEEVPA